MQDKKKRVITANHVLVVCGLIGIGVILFVMGRHWVNFGTPFYGGLDIFGTPIADTLLSLAVVTFPFVMGILGLRKSKRSK